MNQIIIAAMSIAVTLFQYGTTVHRNFNNSLKEFSMNPQTVNLLLYLLFWAAFCLGTVITFRLTASAVDAMDQSMPFGCPPRLRRLTWMLAAAWSISMFSESILQSAWLLDPAFTPQMQAKAAEDL